jgi:hypothetical protein
VSPSAADLVQAVDIDMDRCAGSVPVLRAAGDLGPPFLDLHPLRLSILALGCQHESNNRIVCVLPELPYH